MAALFFYKGKTFDNEKEFFKYAADWTFKMINSEEFERMFETFKKDIWMNIEMYQLDGKISNGACNEVIQELFLIAFQKFIGKFKEIENG